MAPRELELAREKGDTNYRVRVAGCLGPESIDWTQGMTLEIHAGTVGPHHVVACGPCASASTNGPPISIRSYDDVARFGPLRCMLIEGAGRMIVFVQVTGRCTQGWVS